MLTLFSCIVDPGNLEKEVIKDFKQKYPEYEYISSSVGEGDLAVAYVHVKFKKAKSDSIFEKVWQYWDLVEEGWTHRDNLRDD